MDKRFWVLYAVILVTGYAATVTVTAVGGPLLGGYVATCWMVLSATNAASAVEHARRTAEMKQALESKRGAA